MRSILGCSFWGKPSLPLTPAWTKVAHKASGLHAWLLRRFLHHLWHRIREAMEQETRGTRPRPRLHHAQSFSKPVRAWSSPRWPDRQEAERIWRAQEWNVSNISLKSLIDLLSLINITIHEVEVLAAQPCQTLCNPRDCSLPGSSGHGFLQVRILEWVSIAFSRRSFWPWDWTQVSCIAGRFFTVWSTRGAL